MALEDGINRRLATLQSLDAHVPEIENTEDP
jgi:hypothetical protein